ncbi:MAG: hypothetical protein IPN84_16520 [Sphingomonadales bacterium]|nr:hypothetical protein [Sphingomonadales bacterium]
MSDIKIKGIASRANGTFTLKRDHLVYSGSHSATPADLRGFLFSRWWQHFGSKSISKGCESVMAANKISYDTLPTAALCLEGFILWPDHTNRIEKIPCNS